MNKKSMAQWRQRMKQLVRAEDLPSIASPEIGTLERYPAL